MLAMDEGALLQKAGEVFAEEPRLIELSGVNRVTFVGDTHGDLEATQLVVKRHFQQGNALVFLGDYVDRGPNSQENLEYLLQLKVDHPKQLYLLQGNHEAWQKSPFYPADFWEGLTPEKQSLYAKTLARLPWALATPNGLLALHGALPAVKRLKDINSIAFGSEEWRQITWGDWQEDAGYFLGDYGGRPQLGRDYFQRQMESFQMKVLVRSHQPHVPRFLFDDRCLTIFTSLAYGSRERLVASASLDQEIQSAKDLVLESV